MNETGSARERAYAFVLAHAEAAGRARARALMGELPAAQALAAFPEPDPEASPAAWLPSLALCGELGALRAPRVERACAQLARAQAHDGGFEAQGGEDARLQLTGSLGGYLARSPYARPDLLEAIGNFLAAHWSPDRVQGFQFANLAAYAHYFANTLHEAGDEILQWCGRELERGFRTGALDAAGSARVLLLCDAHALPGARLELAELRVALVAEQAPDGGFGPLDTAESARVEQTLQALAALNHLG